MNNDLLILLSKFSVAARAKIGAVNPAKLFKDKAYAISIFEQIDTQGDEELILMSLRLQEKLGHLERNLQPTQSVKRAPASTEKYLYGARG